MKVALAVLAALAAGACSSGSASPFDGNDDLHCSVLMHHSLRTSSQTAGNAAPKSFALSAWYNKKIDHKPDMARAAPIMKAAKADFEAAQPAIRTCEARASRDLGFAAFEREAVAAWKQVASENASAR